MAARKHQDKILILVKMLYSGHGSTLPCFESGIIQIHNYLYYLNIFIYF